MRSGRGLAAMVWRRRSGAIRPSRRWWSCFFMMDGGLIGFLEDNKQ